jgi:hypothetical protein
MIVKQPLRRRRILRGTVALIWCAAGVGACAGTESVGTLNGAGGSGGTAPVDEQPQPQPQPQPTATPTATTEPPPPPPPDAGPTCPEPTCEEWSGEPIDPEAFEPCDDPTLPLCTDGRCVPNSLVPEGAVELLRACDDGNRCVPGSFIEKFGEFIAPTCRSIDDAEGRCLSLCIPQVAEQAGFLPQDTCESFERCAPCFDPRTGESTGACNQGCDGGPCEAAVTFARCCGDQGSCVPSSVVPEADQSLLGTDTCTGADRLCAPDALASSTYIPPTCRSVIDAEGRCLASCIPQIEAQASLLPQDTCADGELCAPCYDPVGGGTTGACERNGDEPTEDPVLFDECCNTEGSCVPTEILSEAQQGALGQDSCEEDFLCAPKVFAGPGLRAETCESIGGAEGRCLPECVPMVAARADQLPKDICEDGQLCAPCYDPISGEDTMACSQNGDSPTQAPYTFPECCGGIGVCVPDSLVSEEQQELLGTDTCTGDGILCAPRALTEPGAQPAPCRSFGSQDREGRCLAACIPQIADRADQLRQETCDAGELCAPCYDPVNGEDTGACRVNGDEPVDENPGRFPTCESTNLFCAECEPCDGRCVPDYIVPDDQAWLLLQKTCADDELCAPCYSPIGGEPTGACGPDGGPCPP